LGTHSDPPRTTLRIGEFPKLRNGIKKLVALKEFKRITLGGFFLEKDLFKMEELGLPLQN